jgi:hydrogenase nickel incorporation protein HypA/HybF
MPAIGLMQHALHLALEEADHRHARRIHSLRLRVGRRAGVEVEALITAFGVVSRGTLAEGARVEIEPIPVTWYCQVCASEVTLATQQPLCPQCGGTAMEMRHGREMEVAEMEVS